MRASEKFQCYGMFEDGYVYVVYRFDEFETLVDGRSVPILEVSRTDLDGGVPAVIRGKLAIDAASEGWPGDLRKAIEAQYDGLYARTYSERGYEELRAAEGQVFRARGLACIPDGYYRLIRTMGWRGTTMDLAQAFFQPVEPVDNPVDLRVFETPFSLNEV